MERRLLGKAGFAVPVIGLGTYRVFHVRDDAGEARCEAVVDAALERGANLMDSSPMYGEAERVLALTLAERRDEALVATKVWARDRALGEQQIEQALAFYERVDLYQVHNLLAVDEHLPCLLGLKERGLVRAIGVSHYLPSAIGDLLALMRDRVIDTVQVPYTPVETAVEAELLPEAERLGIGVIVMSPLGAGQLVARAPAPEALAPLAAFGVHTWPQALLKWILSDRRVHAVIPATSSPDHMRENAAAGEPPWFGADERAYVGELVARS
jgi:aryl-alcohol dehydrogenase-like predicted oxidoreductase